MDKQKLQEISARWEGVEKKYRNIKFEEAHADMKDLLAELRKQDGLYREITELKLHILKRNNDMQAFVSEVARLAQQKYSDVLEVK